MYFSCYFKQKTAYELRISDWSSDVCSSDLQGDWPALQKPNEIVLPVQRGETQCADRHHACTNLVCRPLDQDRTKGGVQQRFHGAIALRREGCYVRQFLRFHGSAGISAASAGLSVSCANEKQ